MDEAEPMSGEWARTFEERRRWTRNIRMAAHAASNASIWPVNVELRRGPSRLILEIYL